MSSLQNQPGSRGDPSEAASYLSDWRMADTVGTAVVLSVADFTDRSVMALPELSGAVDPDALEELLDGPHNSVEISFSYAGCEVSLAGDGELTLR